VKQPIWKKFNPVWWLLNDDEPDPPDWQLPGKPYVIRQLSWYARNPFQNFGKYVFGVYDRNYTVTGTAPVYATNWSEIDPSKQAGRSRLFTLGLCVSHLFRMRTSTLSGMPDGNGRASSASSSI
jgi:hypothetical protein